MRSGGRPSATVRTRRLAPDLGRETSALRDGRWQRGQKAVGVAAVAEVVGVEAVWGARMSRHGGRARRETSATGRPRSMAVVLISWLMPVTTCRVCAPESDRFSTRHRLPVRRECVQDLPAVPMQWRTGSKPPCSRVAEHHPRRSVGRERPAETMAFSSAARLSAASLAMSSGVQAELARSMTT
jgi:hypothetical protein